MIWIYNVREMKIQGVSILVVVSTLTILTCLCVIKVKKYITTLYTHTIYMPQLLFFYKRIEISKSAINFHKKCELCKTVHYAFSVLVADKVRKLDVL